MEAFGVYNYGEWGTFSPVFFSEELDCVSHSIPRCSFAVEHDPDGWFYSLDAFNSSLQYIEQESSFNTNSTDVCIAAPSNENYYPIDYNHFPVENGISGENTGLFIPGFRDILMEDMCGQGFQNIDDSHSELNLKRKLNTPVLHMGTDGSDCKANTDSSANLKKKIRVLQDVHMKRNNVQPKKGPKSDKAEEDGINAGSDVQSSSSYSSEDDQNDSQQCAALNINGKMRATRRSATDPQSLYARKRRERINERLKILQKLVPNGTKVDISTMLEEALHYVKFLQLQIKLLSSDDMWMYAPLAYNGMDINIEEKISQLL